MDRFRWVAPIINQIYHHDSWTTPLTWVLVLFTRVLVPFHSSAVDNNKHTLPTMLILTLPISTLPLNSNRFPPFLIASPPKLNWVSSTTSLSVAKAQKKSTQNVQVDVELGRNDPMDYTEQYEDENEDDFTEFSPRGGLGGKEEEKDYDRDPEFADILGTCLDDPQKAQSKMEERLRKKRNKILHTKTGSATPMKVTFNKFDFSNSYIWFEFYNTPLEKDVNLICDTIRSWHIIGRLGGCNSMNMQLSQSTMDTRPSYDAIQGANVNPTTFYNIGDFEIQDNVGRIWVDIGTSEPLILDVLINALTQISSDYVGIKHLVFGGNEYENWKESLTSEDAGYSCHKI